MRKIALFVLSIIVVCASTLSPRALAQQEERKPLPGVSVEKGGVLPSEWRFVLEPAYQYSHISAKQLVSLSGFTVFHAIHIGTFDLKDIKRDIHIASVTARLGYKDMELNVKVPWLYRRDTQTSSGSSDEAMNTYVADDSGLGDIEAGFVYRLIKEHGSIPDIMLNLGVKSDTGRDPYGLETESVSGEWRLKEFPTGTGHWGYSGGLIFVKTSDPVVLFLNLTYFYNAPRDVGKSYGDIDPGDSFEYNLGTVLALNEKFSLNYSLNHRITGKTEQNGAELEGSNLNIISLNIGGTYAISRRFSVDITASIGLSADANDVTLQCRVPIAFGL